MPVQGPDYERLQDGGSPFKIRTDSSFLTERPLYVAYFDEVKPDAKFGRNRYLVGGLAIPMTDIGALEKKLTKLAFDTFGSTDLVPETEFHADYIYRAKSHYKGWDMQKRADLLGTLCGIISETPMHRVYASINLEKLYKPEDAAEFAFAHFIERLQMAVGTSPCILIGDLDDEQVRAMVRDFSRFRQQGTPWAYGIEIGSVVDSVHFCRSHHSRLVQLADAYVWLETHTWRLRKGLMADLVTKAMDGKNMFPSRYKIWP
ncbi:MAG: DUF3800 domain-containing protein [Pseudorhodoplanes sp.]